MTKRLSALILAVLFSGTFAAGQSKAWDILREILLVPGVSGHEGPVADFIQGKLPSGYKVQRDGMHNVWFTVGSGKPHILFVAHSDELGWVVDKITPDGRVRVKRGGGMLAETAEARPVLIHTAHGAVPGVVAPRPGYDNRRPQADAPEAPFSPENFDIFLGVSTEAEARALGVAEGDSVTPKKVLVDFAPGLMASRAVDDRAGCAALIDAALRLKAESYRNKTVTFAWDVQEETGLFGAAELAKTLKPDFVFAIDTFVSTDSPLESKRFGYLPVGKGAVLRSVDSSNVTPKTEIRKVMAIAKKRGIPIQVGNSRGGNDGSVFLAGGAVDIPLSWPGSYAHSLIEKIDRRDLEALTDLILAVISDWK
ncbi:MAG TPA: M20/M25/M40 family metallo-hydrolase [Candidatus Latescibacteria bacterium]|nr:M20/M25/M40 family metallo-hydrolase [Candidatus Latescibacterota bacterium]